MVKPSPATPLVMTEANLLLQFEIITLDPGVGRRRGKPVVIRLGFPLRPLDQQPLLGRGFAPLVVIVRRANAPAGKPRRERRVAAVSPSDLLPGIGGKFQGQRLGRGGLVLLVAAQPRGRTPAAGLFRLRRQRRLAGGPEHRGGAGG